MELLGLPLSTLLATFAAFAAAVTALYLLKQRRRRAQVAYLPLWQSLLGDQHNSALFNRLKRLASLLLTLLIVALLVFALGDPKLGKTQTGRTVVVLIDAGETMLVEDGQPTRLAQAVGIAREVLDGLGPQDRALIAQLDEGVTPLSPLTDDRGRLLSALEGLQATHLETDLAEGLRFARDVTRGHPQAEMVVISDGQVRDEAAARAVLEAYPEGPTLRFLRAGQGPVDNVGISAFAARRYPLDRTHVEVLVRTHNQTDRALPARLTLSADGREVHRQQLTLPARGESQVVLTDLPGADRSLTARLSTPGLDDGWPLDDEAVARVPARERLRVLLVSEGNRYLEAALLLDEYLRVRTVAPGSPLDTRDFDVVIFDAHLPAAPPAAPALYLLPQAGGQDGYSPLALGDGSEQRPFVGRVAGDHPLTRFAALTDVNIRAAREVQMRHGDRAVVRSERGNPLVVSGERDGQPFVALTFDPRQSDLPMRVAWPLLVLNALDMLSGQSPDYVGSQRVGEVIRWQLPEEATGPVQLHPPEGPSRALAVRDGHAQFVPRRAGLHRLTGTGFEHSFAVQRRQTEPPSLTAREVLAGADAGQPRSSGASPDRQLWPWLLLVALGLSSLEWVTFHRRVTV